MIRQFDGNKEIKNKTFTDWGFRIGNSLEGFFYQVTSASCDKSIVDHYSWLGTITKGPVPEFLLHVASVKLGDSASKT